MTPKVCSLSTLKIKYNPAITISPKNNSKRISLLLKNNGSISDVNNAPVLIAIKAIDTLDTFMAEKKAIQCKAIIIPLNKNLRSAFGEVFSDFLLINR